MFPVTLATTITYLHRDMAKPWKFKWHNSGGWQAMGMLNTILLSPPSPPAWGIHVFSHVHFFPLKSHLGIFL